MTRCQGQSITVSMTGMTDLIRTVKELRNIKHMHMPVTSPQYLCIDTSGRVCQSEFSLVMDVLFMGDVLARQDHANDCLARKEAKDIIMDVSKKDITFRAAGSQLSRRVLLMNAEKKILKAAMQMQQATTQVIEQTSTLFNSIDGTILLMLSMIISVQKILGYAKRAERH